MEVSWIVAGLDEEIARLEQVRALLVGKDSHITTTRGPMRKRVMSAEGRARIAAAQRARWAKQKRAAKKAA